MIRCLYQFLLDFGLILGALFEPCSPPRGPQDGPRAAQDAFRRRLGGVLEPGAAQEAPRPSPGLDFRSLQALILDNFESYLPKFIKVMPTEYKRVLIEMHSNLDKSKSTVKG